MLTATFFPFSNAHLHRTTRNIIRILNKTATAARKWEPGSDARRLLRSRVQNPYFEPLKGKPALLDDLIERINAYGNYVSRLVRRRVQRSLAKCGFRERFPPYKAVSINNYRIIPRPSNIPSQEWRRLIGRGERIAYTTTDTGLCHRANAALAPIIKLDSNPNLSGHMVRNLDLVNIIHAGTHSDNILRQTYLNA
ncbi:unnamed protein product [Schistocephalus solidus]|uniref:Uncharacterized protein n=1 Tax=Schistocephalus solidus TaxID=70667 RepID=A0A183SBA7_SCHSO|nr:unnamed protein product [Schistocephalus solidus]